MYIQPGGRKRRGGGRGEGERERGRGERGEREAQAQGGDPRHSPQGGERLETLDTLGDPTTRARARYNEEMETYNCSSSPVQHGTTAHGTTSRRRLRCLVSQNNAGVACEDCWAGCGGDAKPVANPRDGSNPQPSGLNPRDRTRCAETPARAGLARYAAERRGQP